MANFNGFPKPIKNTLLFRVFLGLLAVVFVSVALIGCGSSSSSTNDEAISDISSAVSDGSQTESSDISVESSDNVGKIKYIVCTELYEVEFVDFVTNCNTQHSVGCTHTVTRGKNYVAALVTIGTKAKTNINHNGEIIEHIGYRNPSNIYGVMLHEVGHALGLKHSDNPSNIMYPYDLETLQYLTEDDLKLLYNKYY